MTPLYDAVGRGIGVHSTRQRREKTPPRASLVVMTDGMENDSKEFNHVKITGLIKARQDAGWLVVFPSVKDLMSPLRNRGTERAYRMIYWDCSRSSRRCALIWVASRATARR